MRCNSIFSIVIADMPRQPEVQYTCRKSTSKREHTGYTPAVLIAILIVFTVLAAPVAADIHQWEWVNPNDHSEGKQKSDTLCPDGAGVSVGDSYLMQLDLTKAHLIIANLSNISFYRSTLTDADMSGANLTTTNFRETVLAGADFTDTVIHNAIFWDTTANGFTAGQLYSTASYQSATLSKVFLDYNDLTSWDFSGQNLTDTHFTFSTLLAADFSGAVITGADFRSTTDGTTYPGDTIDRGFTEDQLYSTASYLSDDLSAVGLDYNDMTDWNFAGKNLTGASFLRSALTGADFTNAVVTRAELGGTTSSGFTASQFYSTASYKSGDLSGVSLYINDLTGWNFANMNLIDAKFDGSVLTNVDFAGAEIVDASFMETTSRGFTAAQLYSTASYQSGDLSEIRLGNNDLTGWVFVGKNLTYATFQDGIVTDVDFGGACLIKAHFDRVTPTNADFTGADTRGAFYFDATGAASTLNMIHPDGTVDGFTLMSGDSQRIWDCDEGITIFIKTGFAIDADSELQMWFDDSNWGSTISFQSGIDVQLNGVLRLDFDYTRCTPMIGMTFDLFDWDGVAVSGGFYDIESNLDSGLNWDFSDLYTTGEVMITPEPGTLGFLLMGGLALLRGRGRFHPSQ